MYHVQYAINMFVLSRPHTHSLMTSVQVVLQADPDLVALHCQEVGGKDFEICMPKVSEFIKYVPLCVAT